MDVVRVAVTGHRPDKLHVPENDIIDRVIVALEDLGATWMYQGMASGFDLLAARAAWIHNTPFAAVRPWMTHGPMKGWESRYEWAMEKATQIIETDQSTRYPGPWAFERRNRYMVDRCEHLVAYYDGTKGGTHNCIEYASRRDIPITFLKVD
jgi:uncharacterized phage-like protein YoqJ